MPAFCHIAYLRSLKIEYKIMPKTAKNFMFRLCPVDSKFSVSTGVEKAARRDGFDPRVRPLHNTPPMLYSPNKVNTD